MPARRSAASTTASALDERAGVAAAARRCVPASARSPASAAPPPGRRRAACARRGSPRDRRGSPGCRGSPARRSRQSATSTSAMAPSETTALKPSPCSAAQSRSAVASAPDCETSASRPGAAVAGATVAASFAPGTIRPSESGPMIRMQVRAGGVEDGLPRRRIEAAGHDHGAAAAARRELGDGTCDLGGRHGDDREVGRVRQVGDARGGRQAEERAACGRDRPDRAGEAAGDDVARARARPGCPGRRRRRRRRRSAARAGARGCGWSSRSSSPPI